MKYIITEEQNTKLQIVRRLDEIWELIHNLYPWQYPCDYHSLGHFVIGLRVEMFEVLSLDWFNSDNESVVWDVVTQVYGDKIKEHYEGWCEDNEEPITESKSPRIRRVSHIVKEFMEHLDSDDICNYWDRNEGDRYVNEAMSELINYLDSEYFKGIDFDELYDELVEYGVRLDITEFFYDTIDGCTE
jgi:hypothetical protein